MRYKPFYLKTIKNLLDLGFLANRIYYISTSANLADIYSRPSSMGLSNLEEVLDTFGSDEFSLKSPTFGHFNVKEHFDSFKLPPLSNWNTNIEGLYKDKAVVLFNTPCASSQPPLPLASYPDAEDYCHVP